MIVVFIPSALALPIIAQYSKTADAEDNETKKLLNIKIKYFKITY